MNVALVNTNRIKPPIAPIGLDYVAEALNFAGHHVEVLDLCWEDDCDCAIEKFFDKKEFLLIGVTLRNTDDCVFTSRQSFLVPFSAQLAKLMYRAGCVGINFGVDSGDERILKRLRRDFTPNDILRAVRFCKEAGILVMLDLLIGSPGETEVSIARTIELTRLAKADRIGVAVGVRVYPGTKLENLIEQEGMRDGCVGGNGPFDPIFFLEPQVAPSVFNLLDKLIGEDRRYFFFDPSRPTRNYNYNANQLLVDAIRKGYRGAYWDILRRCE